MIIRLLTIHFLALLVSGIFLDAKTSPTTDISQDCSDNYQTRIYLSFGNGYTDARIVLLRSDATLFRNCSLFVIRSPFQKACEEKCATIVVAEFLSYDSFGNFSCTSLIGGVFIFLNDTYVNIWKDICHHPMQKIGTYLVKEEKFEIDLHFTNFSGLIKLTVTSTKFQSNCTQNEIRCILDGQLICIDKLLECDGNFNCGTPRLYDEYCTNLYVKENILFAVIYGSCLVAVLIFFFVQLLRTCVPTVAAHFFEFKEGEEYKFVLTSQSLPPLELYKNLEDNRQATDTEIY